MRIKKKLLPVIFISVPVIILSVIAIVYFAKANKKWDDQNSWGLQEKASFPINNTEYLSLDIKEENGNFHVSIPYCLLYSAEVVSETQSKLLCSMLPYYSQELLQRFPTEIELQPDISITYDSKKDVLPTEYLGRVVIDDEALQSVGSKDIPVSIEMDIVANKPKKTVSSILKHYSVTKNGNKDAYEDTSIKNWSIKNVKIAADYSEAEKKEIISEWREKAWKELNEILKTDEFLEMSDEQQLVNTMSSSFTYHEYYCPPTYLGGQCEAAYLENSSTNVLFYIYNSYYFDKPLFERLTGIFRNRILPFATKYNPEMAEAQINCIFDGCEEDYFSLELYDTQACPVNYLGNEGEEEIKQFFLDFREEKSERYLQIQGENLKDDDFILDMYEVAKDDFEESGYQRKYSYDVMLGLDDLCYKFIKDDISNTSLIEGWEDMYIDVLWSELIIEEGDVNRTKEDVLFELILSADRLNSMDSVLIPSPVLPYQRILSGVQEQDDFYSYDGYWSTISETMRVLYLTSIYLE